MTPKHAGNRSDLMTVEQVAAYLQLNKLTVYKYVRDGRIPASKLGKAYRIRKADVDWFLEGQKVAAPERSAGRPAGRPAISAVKHSDEIAVGPQRSEQVTAQDRDISRKDPLEWVIRGLH